MEEKNKRLEKIAENVKQDILRELKNSLPGDVITITINLKVS